MSYCAAFPYKCIKCGHEFKFSPDDPHPAPKTSDGRPSCPKCWDEFLEALGLGYCTVAWTKEGSAYEIAVREGGQQ